MDEPIAARVDRRPALRPRLVRHEGRARRSARRGRRRRALGLAGDVIVDGRRRRGARLHRHRGGARARVARTLRSSCEPTELTVAIAQRGFAGFEIETRGVAAHGSRPDLGIDAIAMMGPVLVALDELGQRLQAGRRHPLVGAGVAARLADRGRARALDVPGALRADRRAAHAARRDRAPTIERELRDGRPADADVRMRRRARPVRDRRRRTSSCRPCSPRPVRPSRPACPSGPTPRSTPAARHPDGALRAGGRGRSRGGGVGRPRLARARAARSTSRPRSALCA